jgi:hypothetical protein
MVLVPMTAEQARRLPRGRSMKNGKPLKKKFEAEEKPPKSLIIIWFVVAAELGFDLGTTIIAFQALLGGDDECCGETVQLGYIPLTFTLPFFLLLTAELSFLCRIITLTLWPSLMLGDIDARDEDGKTIYKSSLTRMLCCCFKWNAKLIMSFLNFMVVLNPFFGCVIAWMLMYQSDKTESFIVLGFEGGSILLHFLSIWLEGECKTYCGFLFHCIPLIPFIASVSLVLVYLKQGGVCYKNNFFKLGGCEICPNGYPPIDMVCQGVNGTNFTIAQLSFIDFDDASLNGLDDLEDIQGNLTARSNQTSYCEGDKVDGPENTNFCFFEYQ